MIAYPFHSSLMIPTMFITSEIGGTKTKVIPARKFKGEPHPNPGSLKILPIIKSNILKTGIKAANNPIFPILRFSSISAFPIEELPQYNLFK
jgi:hypothetical protein